MAGLGSIKSTLFPVLFTLASCLGGPRSESLSDTPGNGGSQGRSAPATVVEGAQRTSVYLPLLKGRRVAVVANPTSIVKRGGGHVHLVDTLRSRGIDIVKVFAPEHGFRGEADAGEKVADGTDSKTGLPIVSLYGKNRKPTPNQLEGIDVVLFDIQDVGVRFYTYIATLQLVMEACAEAGLPVVVLDRPNPNGHYVDGPVLEKENASFLGMNEIPLVYGMTIGEYATMVDGEGWLGEGLRSDLTVVRLEGYNRSEPYGMTVPPSPNLPNDRAVNLYPSLGLFEGTAVNAGRGTDAQFQRYGASFLDSTVMGFRYVPRPNSGARYPKEEGKICYGEDLSEEGRMAYVSLEWLMHAYANSPDKKGFFNTASFTKHAGTAELQRQIEQGYTESEIRQTWSAPLRRFLAIRERYLLYP